ncbi:MAG: endonuclease/exonuclease/phosphatase family protein [Gammaproteobacteria bacterium]
MWRSVQNGIETARPFLMQMQKWASLERVLQKSQGQLHTQYEQSSFTATPLPNRPIKILSFNIQAGLPASGYVDYVRNGIRQIVPMADRAHLMRIAETIADFDIVMLQEVDCGSIRSGFVNQLSYLADAAGFEFSHQQLNRDMGRFGQFSNGLLSRFLPNRIENHRLPGLRGRGAIIARYQLQAHALRATDSRILTTDGGGGEQNLTVVGLHLALSERARARQIAYVLDRVRSEPNVIVMGDLNCCEQSAINTALGDSSLEHVNYGMGTFPSWAPRKCIDHIWISPHIEVMHVEVLPTQLSDHCPLCASVCFPVSTFNVSM